MLHPSISRSSASSSSGGDISAIWMSRERIVRKAIWNDMPSSSTTAAIFPTSPPFDQISHACSIHPAIVIADTHTKTDLRRPSSSTARASIHSRTRVSASITPVHSAPAASPQKCARNDPTTNSRRMTAALLRCVCEIHSNRDVMGPP
ncbi:hypothetical protein GC169_03650 [bacterium]|nr:hypothetical protein [bacterium]